MMMGIPSTNYLLGYILLIPIVLAGSFLASKEWIIDGAKVGERVDTEMNTDHSRAAKKNMSWSQSF